MIKQNSRKLLLMLAHPTIAGRGVSILVFERVFTSLSESGRRSLINQLIASGVIWNERRSTGTFIGITEQGVQTLQSLYPALQPQHQVEWHLLSFTLPTKSDPQFRTLAQLLKQEHWIRLSRGVYAHPFGPSARLQVTMQTLYNRNIILSGVSEWKMGFSRTQMVRLYNLESLSDIYSSISKEAHRLLDSSQTKKELSNQFFLQLFSIVSRFESSFQTDVGLLPILFPGSVSGPMAYDSFSALVLETSQVLENSV